MTYDKITLSNDFDDLPPPYCYRYKMDIELAKEALINFSVEYYGREELDLDEIEAEGFSENDDFRWKGALPLHWKEELERQLGATVEGKSKSGAGILVFRQGKPQDRKPDSTRDFEYFVQELIQAIYEVSGRQNSLTIKMLYNSPDKRVEQYELFVSFYERKAVLVGPDKSKKEVEWTKTQKTLETLFQYDLEPVSDTPPKKEGFFIDSGDNFWYRLLGGKGAKAGRGSMEKVLVMIRGLNG